MRKAMVTNCNTIMKNELQLQLLCGGLLIELLICANLIWVSRCCLCTWLRIKFEVLISWIISGGMDELLRGAVGVVGLVTGLDAAGDFRGTV